MFGAESTIRRDSLQRAGASGLLHQLLVRFGNDVETLDDEALGDECSVEKKSLTWRNDIKERMRMRVRTTMTLTQTQLDLESRNAQSCAHEKKCVVQAPGSVFCEQIFICRDLVSAATSKMHQKHQSHHRLCCFACLLWLVAHELWHFNKTLITKFQIESLHQRVQLVCGEILRQGSAPIRYRAGILDWAAIASLWILGGPRFIRSSLHRLFTKSVSVQHRAVITVCGHQADRTLHRASHVDVMSSMEDKFTARAVVCKCASSMVAVSVTMNLLWFVFFVIESPQRASVLCKISNNFPGQLFVSFGWLGHSPHALFRGTSKMSGLSAHEYTKRPLTLRSVFGADSVSRPDSLQ